MGDSGASRSDSARARMWRCVPLSRGSSTSGMGYRQGHVPTSLTCPESGTRALRRSAPDAVPRVPLSPATHVRPCPMSRPKGYPFGTRTGSPSFRMPTGPVTRGLPAGLPAPPARRYLETRNDGRYRSVGRNLRISSLEHGRMGSNPISRTKDCGEVAARSTETASNRSRLA